MCFANLTVILFIAIIGLLSYTFYITKNNNVKLLIILYFIFLLLSYFISENIYESFDDNISKWQQSNEKIKNKEDLKLPQEINPDGRRKNDDDNTFGDVLVEWDFKDTGNLLNGGEMEGLALHTLKCSKSCCPSQWPVPKELQDKFNVCGRDLVRSNYTCGNGSGTGCVCLPRSHRDFLARRGDNATWNEIDS